MSKETDDLTFEAALAELESVVAKLEEGNLTLDESLALFERGQTLTEFCNDQLDRAALRVEQLTADGEIVDVTTA